MLINTAVEWGTHTRFVWVLVSNLLLGSINGFYVNNSSLMILMSLNVYNLLQGMYLLLKSACIVCICTQGKGGVLLFLSQSCESNPQKHCRV